MSPIHVWMFVSLVGWVKLDLQGVIYVYLPYSSNAESEKKPGKEATCKFSNILVEAKNDVALAVTGIVATAFLAVMIQSSQTTKNI